MGFVPASSLEEIAQDVLVNPRLEGGDAGKAPVDMGDEKGYFMATLQRWSQYFSGWSQWVCSAPGTAKAPGGSQGPPVPFVL